MGRVLGIIGGGQLGMMLTEAAKKMPQDISKVIVLDPTENCPAAKVGAEQIIADFKDKNAIIELGSKSDILTYEIESGDTDVLEEIENKTQINPSPKTLKIIQDKYEQKSFLSKNKIPVADFVIIDSFQDLNEKIHEFRFPCLLKVRHGGYDGRGNFKIDSESQIKEAFEYFQGKKIMLEKFVDFKMEVSVISARNINGQISTYPVVENIHEENILRMTIAPARVSKKIADKAEIVAKNTMKVLRGAGVFGIEMFVTNDEDILVNEIAPRVHNSGHHTLNSSKTSQFEQHLRAILGLDLGSTELTHSAVMYNILGPNNFEGKYKMDSIVGDDIFLKMYGKEESKPKRKLGHFNLIDIKNNNSINDLLDKVEQIKKSINIQPLT